MDKMAKCNFCGNKNLVFKETEYIYKHEGHFMLFENVPCEECTFCGERYYEAKTLKKIERDFFDILNQKRQPLKENRNARRNIRRLSRRRIASGGQKSTYVLFAGQKVSQLKEK